MAEKDFQKALAAGMRWAPGAHYFKIPDLPVAQLQAAGLKIGSSKKPYDCYILHNCLFYALELKQTRSLSLGGGEIRDHQEAYLLQVEAAGGVGLVVVNFNLVLSAAQQKKRGQTALDVAYGAPMSMVAAARSALGRDSIPLEWWETHGWPLERRIIRTNAAWDPNPLLASAREWRMRTPL